MTSRSKSALLLCSALVPLANASPAHAQSSPSAFTHATRFDGERRVTGTIAPDPDGSGPLKFAAVRNTYDGAGRLTKVEKGELASWQSESIAPSAWTGFSVFQAVDTEYDSADRKVKENMSGSLTGTGPLTAKTLSQFEYDNLGRLKCTAVRMNPGAFGSPPAACTPGTAGAFGPDRITKNIYDDAGQLLQVREGVGTSIEAAERTMSYNGNGKLLSLKDGESNLTDFKYDGHDRLWRTEFPVAAKGAAASNPNDYEELSYDANGNITTRRTRANQVIAYQYDALNRMTVKDMPGSSADVGYTYDLRGLQTGADFTANGQGISNSFNGFGELTSSTTDVGGTARTLGYQYDAHGNRTGITHHDNVSFTYQYDGLDRLTEVLQGTTTGLATLEYDQLGRRSRLTRGNGRVTGWHFGEAGRLTRLAHNLVGTAHDQEIIFEYNPAGQIVSRTADNDLYAFTGISSGNIPTTTNGLNQILTSNGIGFVYNANGNLMSDGVTTFGYDPENRLTSATRTGLAATLSYDPLGRLDQYSGTGVSDVRFIHDPEAAGGSEVVTEVNSTGTTLRRYVRGDRPDEVLAQYVGSGTTDIRYHHADERGSMIAWSDGSGTMAEINAYDEYGLPKSGNAGRFQYTGQMWLGEIGVHYYKARMYRPQDGVFMQTDPAGYDEGMNEYSYVGLDPINQTDPSGARSVADALEMTWHQLADPVISSFEDTENSMLRVMNIGNGPATLRDYGNTVAAVASAIAPGARAGASATAGEAAAAARVGQSISAKSSIARAGLQRQLAAEEIAQGHAWTKHGGEFRGLGIRTQGQFQRHVESVMANPSMTKSTKDGRTLYVDSKSQTVVWRHPTAEGTAFRPQNFDDYLRLNGLSR